MIKFTFEGQGGASPAKTPKGGFPRERIFRDTVLGGRKVLGVWKGQKRSKVVSVEGGKKGGQRV